MLRNSKVYLNSWLQGPQRLLAIDNIYIAAGSVTRAVTTVLKKINKF